MTDESLDDLVARLQLIDVGLTKHKAVTFKVTSDAQSIFAESADAIVALRADAKRYRWLRDEAWDDNVPMVGGRVLWDYDSSHLDSAIDSARLAEKDKGG